MSKIHFTLFSRMKNICFVFTFKSQNFHSITIIIIEIYPLLSPTKILSNAARARAARFWNRTRPFGLRQSCKIIIWKSLYDGVAPNMYGTRITRVHTPRRVTHRNDSPHIYLKKKEKNAKKMLDRGLCNICARVILYSHCMLKSLLLNLNNFAWFSVFIYEPARFYIFFLSVRSGAPLHLTSYCVQVQHIILCFKR